MPAEKPLTSILTNVQRTVIVYAEMFALPRRPYNPESDRLNLSKRLNRGPRPPRRKLPATHPVPETGMAGQIHRKVDNLKSTNSLQDLIDASILSPPSTRLDSPSSGTLSGTWTSQSWTLRPSSASPLAAPAGHRISRGTWIWSCVVAISPTPWFPRPPGPRSWRARRPGRADHRQLPPSPWPAGPVTLAARRPERSCRPLPAARPPVRGLC